MKFSLGLLFLFLALVFFILSRKKLKETGLPGGQVVYSDTGKWEKLEKPLYDPVSGITGRPDYLVEQEGYIIPVEVKSGRPENPYDSHIYQLAAYCLLVESEYRIRPPYGIIHYQHRSFSIEFTEELENAFQEVLAEMRLDDRRRKVVRSHQHAARCRGCGFKSVCDQRL